MQRACFVFARRWLFSTAGGRKTVRFIRSLFLCRHSVSLIASIIRRYVSFLVYKLREKFTYLKFSSIRLQRSLVWQFPPLRIQTAANWNLFSSHFLWQNNLSASLIICLVLTSLTFTFLDEKCRIQWKKTLCESFPHASYPFSTPKT